jgi:hypothetical protein
MPELLLHAIRIAKFFLGLQLGGEIRSDSAGWHQTAILTCAVSMDTLRILPSLSMETAAMITSACAFPGGFCGRRLGLGDRDDGSDAGFRVGSSIASCKG